MKREALVPTCIVPLVVTCVGIVLAMPFSVAAEATSTFEDLEYRMYRADQLGRHAEALELARRLLEIDADHDDTLINLALLETRLGHPEAAAGWLKRAADAGGLRSERMARIRRYIAMLERPEREEFQQPEQVMATLAFKAGERVADIGAGSGYFTFRAARVIGPEGIVWAIDVEQPMLDYIADRIAENGLTNVKLAKVERDDPLLPPGGVDTILMVDTLHYVEDRAAYAKKLRAGLAPGGRVVIIDYVPKSWKDRPWGPLPFQQVAREEIDASMAEAGLKPVKVHDFLAEQYFVEYRAE